MRMILAVVLLVAMSACAPRKHLITVARYGPPQGYPPKLTLTYTDAEAVAAEERQKANNLRREFDADRIPKGGKAKFELCTGTPAMANLNVWKFEVDSSDGRRLADEPPRYSFPSYFGHLQGWCSWAWIEIPEAFSDFVTVRAYQIANPTRWDYVIRPNPEWKPKPTN